MARRTTEQACETRAAILQTAREQFSEHGYEVSLARIAADAGVTKGALFHHFSSKFDLFKTVWQELQAEMDAEARAAAHGARSRTDSFAAFLAGCRTYLRWAQRPDYQRIVLIDGRAVLGMSDWYEADHAMGQANVLAGIQYFAQKGIIPAERVRPLAILLQSALTGAGFLLSREDPDVDAEALLDAFESMLRNIR